MLRGLLKRDTGGAAVEQVACRASQPFKAGDDQHVAGHDPRNNGSIPPEPIEAVGAQLGTPHRVHDVAVAQEVSLAGSFGVGSLDRHGRSTNFTVNGSGARGARAGGRPSFCRHSGGQGGVNRLNESSVLRQQDELCHS